MGSARRRLRNYNLVLPASRLFSTLEAMADVVMAEAGSVSPKRKKGIDLANLQNKRFKTSELPLTAAQRTSIDNLLYTYKKKGGFDSLRKQVWAQFSEGVSGVYFSTRAAC